MLRYYLLPWMAEFGCSLTHRHGHYQLLSNTKAIAMQLKHTQSFPGLVLIGRPSCHRKSRLLPFTIPPASWSFSVRPQSDMMRLALGWRLVERRSTLFDQVWRYIPAVVCQLQSHGIVSRWQSVSCVQTKHTSSKVGDFSNSRTSSPPWRHDIAQASPPKRSTIAGMA